MMLTRGDKSEFRFYNISSMINKDKKHYYDILEKTQHGDGDITEWILWYANTLSVALDEAESMVSTVLNKSLFWQKASSVALSQRQTDMLNLFLDGYEAKITTKTWASLAKCSADTALRDIHDLVEKVFCARTYPEPNAQAIPSFMTLTTSRHSFPKSMLKMKMAASILKHCTKVRHRYAKGFCHWMRNGSAEATCH